ncbi:MAG: ATP-dependent Clp protease adapter ClpS [Pseudomonadota bacterium]
MAKTVETPTRESATKTKPKVERPPLYKVILLNDDYTPREFVVGILQKIFHVGEGPAYGIMMTAHQKGSCVVAVYTRDVAETKATEATDLGQEAGFPLTFTTEPEE